MLNLLHIVEPVVSIFKSLCKVALSLKLIAPAADCLFYPTFVLMMYPVNY